MAKDKKPALIIPYQHLKAMMNLDATAIGCLIIGAATKHWQLKQTAEEKLGSSAANIVTDFLFDDIEDSFEFFYFKSGED